MKRNVFKWLLVLSVIATCAIGCSDKKHSDIALNEGILTWTPDKDATCYEVALGDKSVICKEATLNLSELCEYEGEHEIFVSSVLSSGKKQELATLGIHAIELQKPSVSIAENGNGAVVYTWQADDLAGGYEYNLNDGHGYHTAEVEEDGMYRVTVEDTAAMTFTITVKDNSKENKFYIGNTFHYDYRGEVLFDVGRLSEYPFYMVSQAKWTEYLVVGTTLPKGVYDLEMSFYAMNSNGTSLSGVGLWGRRITHNASGQIKYVWMCGEGAVGTRTDTAGTIRPANELITVTLEDVKVNKHGETTLTVNDFNADEMLIVADVKLNGKSVIAKEAREREEEEVTFDVSDMGEFVSVYQSEGAIQGDLTIPTNLPNGVYEFEIKYQLMEQDGTGIANNGLYARRITDTAHGQAIYWCEFELDANTPGKDMPLPTQVLTDRFSIKVQNGEIHLYCKDFNKGEIMAVKSVEKIKGSSYRYDVSKLSGKKNVYTCEKDDWVAETFSVETTLRERQQIEVDITYVAVDKDGYMLSGNGMWGRRMSDDANALLWLCSSDPIADRNVADDTIMEPNKPVTKTVKVSVNKVGKFKLSMWDFLEGEKVIFLDVKYQGESILAK